VNYGQWLMVLAVCAVGAEAYAQNAPKYRFEKVSTQDPSCVFSLGEASDLNDAGAVIGRRCIEDRQFAFIVHDGYITLLPQDEEGDAFQLRLNDRFDATLNVNTQAGKRSLLVLNNGRTIQINPLPGDSDLTVVTLNNRRQVLGLAIGPSGRSPILWERGRATRLSTLPNSSGATALSLNDSGVAIGYSSTAEGDRAVLWESGTVMPLRLPSRAIGSQGRDINNRGQAVLNVSFDVLGCGPGTQPTTQPFVWYQGRMKPLPPLPIGDDDCIPAAHASDMNNFGQVVGTMIHQNPSGLEEVVFRAAVWLGGAVYDLEEVLVDESGAPVRALSLNRALAINDVGQILVEEAATSDIPPEYYVLTPFR
jgi:uncharacterized membrane protein